jgi:hypothetical protein
MLNLLFFISYSFRKSSAEFSHFGEKMLKSLSFVPQEIGLGDEPWGQLLVN